MSSRANISPISVSRTASPALFQKCAALLRVIKGFLSREEGSSMLRIEERLHLGPKKELILVNCDGRHFLIAVTGETISPFMEIHAASK